VDVAPSPQAQVLADRLQAFLVTRVLPAEQEHDAHRVAAVPVRGAAQLAYAVDDVRGAAVAWSERTGAGPFFVRDHPPAVALDARGEDAVFCHTSAFGQWGPVQLELVQVHPETSASLREVLPPAAGLHHVAWFADDLAAEQQRLVGLGWPRVMAARTSSGSGYAFHDARHDLGHLIEVYEPTVGLRRLYAHVAAASRNWDGRNPVRPLPGLGPGGPSGERP